MPPPPSTAAPFVGWSGPPPEAAAPVAYGSPPPLPLPRPTLPPLMDSKHPSPYHLRCTHGLIPATQTLASQIPLPIGLIVHPFLPNDTDTNANDGIPLATTPPSSPLTRCRRCRAYLNPHCFFTSQAKHWRCALCGMSNDVGQPSLYLPLNPLTNLPANLQGHPALTAPTLDYEAPSDYLGRPPQPPCFLFCLDASPSAVHLGLTERMLEGYLQALRAWSLAACRTRTGLLLYDSHCCTLLVARSSNSHDDEDEPLQLISCPLADWQWEGQDNPVAQPTYDPSMLPCPLSACLHPLDLMADRLIAGVEQVLAAYRRERERSVSGVSGASGGVETSPTCLSSALSWCQLLMAAMGGVIVASVGSFPGGGVAPIPTPTQTPTQLDPNAKSSYQPAHDWYTAFAIECTRLHISISLVTCQMAAAAVSGAAVAPHQSAQYCGPAAVGMSTLSVLPRITAGQLLQLEMSPTATTATTNINRAQQAALPETSAPLTGTRAAEQLAAFLHRTADLSNRGWEAVVRIRSSSALRLHGYVGHCFLRNTDLCVTPTLNDQWLLSCEISLDTSLLTASTVYFQMAVLYTSSQGVRRIRVSTLALPTSSSLPEIYQRMDSAALTTLLARRSAEQLRFQGLHSASSEMQGLSSKLLQRVSLQMQTSPTPDRLALPSSLRVLPLLLLCLLKSPMLCGSSTTEGRLAAIAELMRLNVEAVGRLLYPWRWVVTNTNGSGWVDSTTPPGWLSSLLPNQGSTPPPTSPVTCVWSGDCVHLWLDAQLLPMSLVSTWLQACGLPAVTDGSDTESGGAMSALRLLAYRHVDRFVRIPSFWPPLRSAILQSMAAYLGLSSSSSSSSNGDGGQSGMSSTMHMSALEQYMEVCVHVRHSSIGEEALWARQCVEDRTPLIMSYNEYISSLEKATVKKR
jgi:protein transport protein SEC24